MPVAAICDGFHAQTVALMFATHGWTITNNLAAADAIVLTGGADVDPKLYGEKCLQATVPYPERDEAELNIFKQGQALGKKFIGICRGGQFLNVMNGGKMWQDVDNHSARSHPIAEVGPIGSDPKDWKKIVSRSDHHQMMRPGITGNVIVVAAQSTYWAHAAADGVAEVVEIDDGQQKWEDVEAVYYPKTNCLCYQPHPEDSTHPERVFFFDLIYKYLGLKGVTSKPDDFRNKAYWKDVAKNAANEQGLPWDDDIDLDRKDPVG